MILVETRRDERERERDEHFMVLGFYFFFLETFFFVYRFKYRDSLDWIPKTQHHESQDAERERE